MEKNNKTHHLNFSRYQYSKDRKSLMSHELFNSSEIKAQTTIFLAALNTQAKNLVNSRLQLHDNARLQFLTIHHEKTIKK
jgi:hypothetical protein